MKKVHVVFEKRNGSARKDRKRESVRRGHVACFNFERERAKSKEQKQTENGAAAAASDGKCTKCATTETPNETARNGTRERDRTQKY